MKITYTHIFVVKGKFPFPTDMLRYDECHPTDGTSAHNITRSIKREPADRLESIEVRLLSRRRAGPTIERWASFGWVVQSHELHREVA